MDEINIAQEEYNPEFETEGIGYGNKSGYDKASKVSFAVSNCLTKRSVEMRTGYKTHITDKFGNVFVKIIADTRTEFIGAITGLTGLLRAEILDKDNDFEEKYKIFKEACEKLKEKYMYSDRYFIPKKDSEGQTIFDNEGNIIPETMMVKDGRTWMPEKTDLLPVPITLISQNGRNVNRRLITKEAEGVWDYEINAYWDGMVELCDEWFAELNYLITEKMGNFGRSTTMG